MSATRADQKKLFTVRTYAADLDANRDKSAGAPQPKSKTPAPTSVPEKKPTAAVSATPLVSTTTNIRAAAKNTTIETKTVPATENPPFHAFQKPGPRKAPVVKVATDTPTFDKAALTAAAGKQTVSTLTAPSHGVLVGDAAKDAQTATIITDTKHKRFSLTRSLSESLTSWVEDKKDTITGKKKPKYSVPQADRRKGVIQKATSMTGRASTADHAQVLERLRNNKKNVPVPLVKPPTVLTPSAPTWEDEHSSDTPATVSPTSHTAPPAVPSEKLTAPPVPIQPVSAPTHTPAHSTVAAAVPIVAPELVTVIPPVQIVVEPKPTPVRIETPKPIAPIVPSIPVYQPTPPVAPPVVSVPEPEPIIEDPQTMPEPEPTPPIKVITPTLPRKQKEQTLLESWLADTNRIVLGGGVMMVGVVILWVLTTSIGPSIFSRTNSDIVTVPPLFAASVQKPIPLISVSRDDVLQSLRGINTTTESLIEGELIIATSSAPLGASDLFSALEINVPIGFTAAISRVTVGSYRQEPWLALNVADEATALGGMLTWETTMSRDLSDWFGTTPTETQFTDDTFNGIDVRILRDSNGAIAIIYGFIQPNVMVIVTSENTFLNLVPRERGN
jgi:hypothetical protein